MRLTRIKTASGNFVDSPDTLFWKSLIDAGDILFAHHVVDSREMSLAIEAAAQRQFAAMNAAFDAAKRFFLWTVDGHGDTRQRLGQHFVGVTIITWRAIQKIVERLIAAGVLKLGQKLRLRFGWPGNALHVNEDRVGEFEVQDEDEGRVWLQKSQED